MVGKKKSGYQPPENLRDKPWIPSAFTLPEGYAIQALERGEASSDQQILALKWIVNGVCKTYDMSFRSDSERDSIFAEGKRFCGLQIISAIKKNMSIYQPEETKERENE